MIFLGGVLVGGSVVVGENVSNVCIASISSLVIDSYSIYHYLTNYMSTGN